MTTPYAPTAETVPFFTNDTVHDTEGIPEEQFRFINSLQTRIGLNGRGSLSTMVVNLQNKYIGIPGATFTAAEVRTVVEAFLHEVWLARGSISGSPVSSPVWRGHDPEKWEDYDSHGLPSRSCNHMRRPHRAHDWKHPQEELVHCWGRNKLPPDVVEKYCTKGCDCEHCISIRQGLHPVHIMCTQKWEGLSQEERMTIAESCAP